MTEKIADILKAYTNQKGISASHVILEEYAEELVAHSVVALPCKIQQKCYVIPTIENALIEVTEMKCIGFSLSCDHYVANLVTDKNKMYQPSFRQFGKSVFLSIEEAKGVFEKQEQTLPATWRAALLNTFLGGRENG